MKNKEVSLYGNYLKNKKIAFVISDKVEAYKAPDYILELRKYGCEVFPYIISREVKYLSKEILKWASSHEVSNKLSNNKDFDALVKYSGKGGLRYD